MTAARALVSPAVQLAALALAALTVCALVVAAVGAAPRVRSELDFGFVAPPRRPGAALDIAATNLRLGGAALVAAWVVQLHPKLRPLPDAALGLVAILNLAVVGFALAAYGPPLLESVAPHGLLELAAFAVCGSAYLAARRRDLTSRQLAAAAALATALLALAALTETYLRLGAAR
jgi:hypothetical protein